MIPHSTKNEKVDRLWWFFFRSADPLYDVDWEGLRNLLLDNGTVAQEPPMDFGPMLDRTCPDREALFKRLSRPPTESERLQFLSQKLVGMTAPPLPEPMQIGFLVYLIDLVRCKRGGAWTGEQRVETWLSPVVIPTQTLAKWLLALRIGSTFSTDAFGISVRCPDVGRTVGPDPGPSVHVHEVAPSCQILVKYLQLVDALDGVRSAIDAEDYRAAVAAVLEMRTRFEGQPALSAMDLKNANGVLVNYAANIAFFLASLEDAGASREILKSFTSSGRLARMFSRMVYDISLREGGVAPYQVPLTETENVQVETGEQMVTATMTHFAARLEATIFCATGEKRGLAVFAGVTAAALTDDVRRVYRRNRLLGRQDVAATSLQVLLDLNVLLENVRARGYRGGPLLYAALGLVLYSAFRMAVW
ncbi:hypothetical protein CSUI_002035 [Cystoisospora suis]|uniref:Uncharacterized protein n=1 Tax=Cystoisospora suis TaxID=483139 RepID=A0A2C6L697_9APIC|nr:hypothetical protein CSUI_002035 [Cystoisospora suis]